MLDLVMLQWIDIVEAFLVEAKWFNKGYVPTIEEYLNNGIATGGTYMALVHAFFLMNQDVTNETAANMEPYPKLFSVSGQILRLWDDLGTAQVQNQKLSRKMSGWSKFLNIN